MATSRIVDINGTPLEYDVLTREVADAQVTGLRNIWGHGSVASHLNPVRLSDILTRAANHDHHDFLTLAEELEERDLHYAGVLGSRKRAITGLSGEITPASDSAADVALADEVRQLIVASDFGNMLADALDGLGKGYSVNEIQWDQSAKQWQPQTYIWRDPRFFNYDRQTGRKLLLITDDSPMGRELWPYKFIQHVPRLKSGIPIRGALARMVAVAYMCKGIALADWMTFAELFGMPIRVGKYGRNVTPAEKNTLRNALANIGTDAAAMIPEGMAIEFIERKGGTGGDQLYQGLCEFLDKQISKGVLGQTMTTDDGASLSQAQVHNDVRMDILEADAKQLADTINRDLIIPYIMLNHGPQKAYPRVTLPIPDAEDLAALTNALEKLVPLGWNVPTAVVHEKFAIRAAMKGEEVLKPAASAAPELPALNQQRVALNRETASDLENWLQEIDASSEWEAQMQPMLDPVLELARTANSADEFIQALPALLDQMDSTELVRSLAISMFKARGLGDSER